MTVQQVLRASLGLLDGRDRRLVALAAAVQMAMSFLDLAGVVLIGLIGEVSVSTVDGKAPPRRVAEALGTVGLGELSGTRLIAVLAGVAAVLFLTKSIFSPFVMARVFRFLRRREALVSMRLARSLLSQPITFLHQRSTQQTAIGLINGVNSAISMVLGQAVIVASELALLLVLAITMFVVNPPIGFGAVVFFLLVGLGLQRWLGARSAQAGQRRAEASVDTITAVQEAIDSYRELTVSDRRALYGERINRRRNRYAEAAAEMSNINMLPKYALEAALVVGTFVLAGVLFATEPASVAAGTFSLFLATATRVMPSLLRLQNATLTMRWASGEATQTFAMANELRNVPEIAPAHEERAAIRQALRVGYPAFEPSIHMADVNFTYPGNASPAVRGFSVRVPAGGSVALVGRSGAGKSTVTDLLLGVLQPDSGEVRIGGLTPAEAVQRWPGGISYVPQQVMLTNDTVRANVALGLPDDLIDDDQVWDALRRARLADYVAAQPEGLDTPIGEHGLRLSGGQRQRLGIARALFSRPRLLVLDEATSALDAETEQSISEMLEAREENVTAVIVAHRLSTIRHADLVLYLDDGVVLSAGTFDEVCDRVPALQRQARLMGLRPA